MSFFPRSRRFVSTVIAVAVIATGTVAQTPQDPDVIRISTDLVQTGVVVLDKQGKFVPGLKAEQFILKVEGKPTSPAFFEQVTAGTEREQKLENSVGRGDVPQAGASTGSSYRGRTIIFFVDDLHLSKASIETTRSAINDFVDNHMSVEDHVALASPSGQIGFLQRFTDLKPVMRAAVARLNYRPYTVRDHEQVPMTEYQALRIEQGDKDASDYFVSELIKANNFRLSGGGGLGPPSGGPTNVPQSRQQGMQPGMTREAAARIVKERASFMMRQSESVTSATLQTLESLMRSSTEMPGRKLVFFVSDGFFLNDRSTAFGERLKQITDAAVRSGAVIYSMDARGMVAVADATSNQHDAGGRLARANIGELAASQDALNALAEDTGGKAFFNTGRLTEAVNTALNETSNYYLLAWRPASEEHKTPGFKRVEVSVVGRPDLTVRLPRGFMVGDPKVAAKTATAKNASVPANKGVDQAVINALASPVASTGLPTTLNVSFLDVPNQGPVLTVATQMSTDVLGYGADGKQPASINVGGVVLDDQGKQAGGFKNRLTVNPATDTSVENPGVIYSHRIPLKPGIYQVRVAASDEKSGRVGSATKWIEIPDLGSKRLMLSSLLLGGQFIGADQKTGTGEQVQFSVDRKFPKGANLNFMTFIYNAAAGAAPDLDAQIKIMRNGKSVVTSPVLKVPIDATTDRARISYGANVGLRTLPPGRYLLEVTITDKLAKTTATQQASFEIL